MPDFDFVVDKELRKSLDSDWKELDVAYGASAWKAVHVLAGSVVEATLVDHLLSIGYSAKDPLRMTLEDAISACRGAGHPLRQDCGTLDGHSAISQSDTPGTRPSIAGDTRGAGCDGREVPCSHDRRGDRERQTEDLWIHGGADFVENRT